MLSGAYRGEWYLQGKSKFPGQLVIDNKKQTIHLEIYGALYIEGTAINRTNRPTRFHTIILGDGPTCTLYNCYWNGSKEVGVNLYQTTYRIEYVFSGFHFSNPEIPVRGGTFSYAHLATWYDGSELHDKLEGQQGLFVDGKEVVQNVLKNETIPINNELTLALWDEVNKHIEELDVSYRVVYDNISGFNTYPVFLLEGC